MKIRNLVKTDFNVVSPEVLVGNLEGLLASNAYLVVKDHNRFLGVLSAFQHLQDPNQPVGQCIGSLPEINCDWDTDEVSKIMQRNGLVTVPVFEGNAFLGIVTLQDIVSALTSYSSDLERKLKTLETNREVTIDGLEKEIEEYRQLIKVFTHYKHSIEKILKTKSDLLADVSHEVRNPLQIILSYARQGLTKVDQNKSELIHRYFSRINDAGEKMLILVDDLLDLSALEAGKSQYEFSSGSLSELVEIVLEEYQLILESKQITCSFTKPTCADSVNMDRNRIIQVIRNLISNACKFSPEAGRIRVEISLVTGHLHCSVIDWGIGIPENAFGELFTKYVRSSHQDIQGNGLGLSIAYRIIKDHQGQIFAKPNPEGGTIFTFTLPLSD